MNLPPPTLWRGRDRGNEVEAVAVDALDELAQIELHYVYGPPLDPVSPEAGPSRTGPHTKMKREVHSGLLLHTPTPVTPCRSNSAHFRQSKPDYGLDLSHFCEKPYTLNPKP